MCYVSVGNHGVTISSAIFIFKENKNLMVGSHFTMTEDKKKSTRLATNEERLMLFEEMFKYGIAFDKHVHHLVGKLVGV